jgi:hypothetical protein
MECDARDERLCRAWLLAIAILHWIVFALLVHNSPRADSAPPPVHNLAAAVKDLIIGI